jgi:hypothetical protein
MGEGIDQNPRIAMNIRSRSKSAPIPAGIRALLVSLALTGAAFAQSAESPDAPKTHTLFQGDDISVGKDKELHPVKDVFGSSWVVDINGVATMVSAKEGPINIKITPIMKLSEVSANVVGLKTVRTYTFENDPATKLTRAMAAAAQANVGYAAAANQANAVSDRATMADNSGLEQKATSGVPGGAAADSKSTSAVQAGAADVASSAGADLELVGDKGNSAGYDAIDVTFKVSCAWPLKTPYIVTMTKFKPPGAEAGMVQNLVYSKAIDPIDAKESDVHFVQAGFPPGFELVDYQMHLYDNGREIATNVAPERTMLTREGAFEYVKSRYLAAHKNDTLHAAPVMGKMPDDLRANLLAGKYGGTYYAKVSKEGLADELYTDPACSNKVDDPYLVTVAKSIRFKPALDKGSPVEGIASVRLASLVM